MKGSTVGGFFSVLCLLLARPLVAQPTAVFELDDYLDPRFPGTWLEEDEDLRAGRRIIVNEILAGAISSFEHQGFYSVGESYFAHLVANNYLGRHQLTLSATAFEAPNDFRDSPIFRRTSDSDESLPVERAREIPSIRVRLKYGRYYGFEESDSPWRLVNRFSVLVGYEEAEDKAGIYNFGAVLDIARGSFLGSFGYDWRIVEDGFDQHRLLYFYRWLNKNAFGPVGFPVRFSFGGERTEREWRWAPIRLELGLEVPVRLLRSSLHITYAPSYRPESPGFESGWNHEVAVFVGIVALSKVFR